MSQNSTNSSAYLSLQGATILRAEPLPPEPIPLSPSPRCSLLSRVGRFALIVGGLCAMVGAFEGALMGALLAPKKDPGALIMVVAVDRFILLGLAGAIVGAAIGALDWGLGARKQKVKK
jgi:hypothetical protein